tara:strand:- start:445 stop:642 length:198 start_codon:yes stop_codon:yes gene_type:complete
MCERSLGGGDSDLSDEESDKENGEVAAAQAKKRKYTPPGCFTKLLMLGETRKSKTLRLLRVLGVY